MLIIGYGMGVFIALRMRKVSPSSRSWGGWWYCRI